IEYGVRFVPARKAFTRYVSNGTVFVLAIARPAILVAACTTGGSRKMRDVRRSTAFVATCFMVKPAASKTRLFGIRWLSSGAVTAVGSGTGPDLATHIL